MWATRGVRASAHRQSASLALEVFEAEQNHRALKPIQCSVVLSRPQTSRTRKADCRCAGEPRTPRVAHMVGTPFGVPEVRFLLRAFTAAEAAFGHSRSCGSGERWNDPVLPNRARPPNWWHMPGQRALGCHRDVLLVWAKTGPLGSNGPRRAYFGPHFTFQPLDPTIS